MIGNGMILYISIIVGLILFIMVKTYYKLSAIMSILVDIDQEFDKRIEISYKQREIDAERLLAEEEYHYPEDTEESELYKNDKGEYSYGAYAKNKRKKEALERGEIFIDDFEEAAVKSERKNPYAR